MAKLAVLESADVATCEIECQSHARDLHERYEISAIPMTVVADADGVVQRRSWARSPPPTSGPQWPSPRPVDPEPDGARAN